MAKAAKRQRDEAADTFLPAVRVRAIDREIAQEKSKAAGMTLSAYTRACVLGHPIRALHELRIVSEVRRAAIEIRDLSNRLDAIGLQLGGFTSDNRLDPDINRAATDILTRHAQAIAEYGDVAHHVMELVTHWCLAQQPQRDESS